MTQKVKGVAPEFTQIISNTVKRGNFTILEKVRISKLQLVTTLKSDFVIRVVRIETVVVIRVVRP